MGSGLISFGRVNCGLVYSSWGKRADRMGESGGKR
jgi:hypothetical protein